MSYVRSLPLTAERLYKPPMNPYAVACCLRASLRFPCATHVLAYAAVSEHVKLTHRFERFPSRIAYAGSFPRAAARTVQDDVDDSEKK